MIDEHDSSAILFTVNVRVHTLIETDITRITIIALNIKDEFK